MTRTNVEVSAADELLASRQKHFGRGLSLAYRSPLTIIRGQGQYLYDEEGRRYLDGVNNVCHVGHCHPEVVAAAHEQMQTLNTNTRYLHPQLSAYVQELSARFPDPLRVCYLVNSGSEAMDLALRMARVTTGRRDVVALAGAYHGHTQALIKISHYKFAGSGGAGCPPTTHIAPVPCTYRGYYRASDPLAGRRYAEDVAELMRLMMDERRSPCAFVAESMLSVAGQIVLPDGYLKGVYEAVRNVGGLCIADEVQTGFGRCGSHFSAFESQGVVPDIVALGKPMGNGHPLAAVVTTEEVADNFDNGMEYFNTYGGNPVSCAVGRAVLRVIDKEGLMAHAAEVGSHLIAGLQALQSRHEVIGDIRGRGLFAGVELVGDRSTLEPARTHAQTTIEGMKDRGILLSVDGPFRNVIKIKPPMVFDRDNADELVGALDEVLTAL
jgi:4-aminobutyrate aminotransferase-like enzyme